MCRGLLRVSNCSGEDIQEYCCVVVHSFELATCRHKVMGFILALVAHSLRVGLMSMQCDSLRQKS